MVSLLHLSAAFTRHKTPVCVASKFCIANDLNLFLTLLRGVICFLPNTLLLSSYKA